MLRDIKSMNQNIFLTVDTTCPLPRSDRPPTPKTPPRSFEPPPTIHEVRPISVSGLYLGIKYAIVVVDIVSSNYNFQIMYLSNVTKKSQIILNPRFFINLLSPLVT